jgi:hypothetical protein
MLSRQLVHDAREILLRGSDAHTGFQPADHLQPMVAALLPCRA